MSNIFTGPRLRLRAIEPSDWELYFQWRKDTDLARLVQKIHFPASSALMREWTDAESKRSGERDHFSFCIDLNDGPTVGTIVTHTTNQRWGTFMYGLWIDSEHRRQGYARDAIYLVLRYFFSELRYEKVNVEIGDYNLPSIRLHEGLGFKQEGRLRRMIFTGGEYRDALFYGMIRDELRELERRLAAIPKKE